MYEVLCYYCIYLLCSTTLWVYIITLKKYNIRFNVVGLDFDRTSFDFQYRVRISYISRSSRTGPVGAVRGKRSGLKLFHGHGFRSLKTRLVNKAQESEAEY